MRYLISAGLLVAAVIHLLPLSGVLSATRLASLYGLDFAEPNLLILMRHRAVLFGMLGVFLLVAAFRPAMQSWAVATGFVSVVSFLWLAHAAGAYNPQIARVFNADIVALIGLIVAAIAMGVQSFRT